MNRTATSVAVAVALVGAALLGLNLYARGGPRLSGGAGGLGIPVEVGGSVLVGYVLEVEGGDAVELHRAWYDDQDEGVRATAVVARDTELGSARSTLGQLTSAERLAGHRVDEEWRVVVELTARRPGTYHLGDLRVSYGDGLRRRTASFGDGVCVVVVPRGEPLQGAVDACDDPA